MTRPLRIVRLANFITPTSGGLRTALHELGRGYAAAGHEPILVIPGARHTDEMTAQGRVIALPGPRVPSMGGYRLLVHRPSVARLLTQLRPDRLEVSDRTTLRWTGAWARRHNIPAVMVSHESLDGLLRMTQLPSPTRRLLAGRLNRATARDYERVVCTTTWAAAEFISAGASNISQVPLGVDLSLFHPDRRSDQLRRRYADEGETLLLCCSRMSVEKRPQRALATIASLTALGIKARLIMAGDGPLRGRLQRMAAGLPVEFTGWIGDRETLAGLLATADVVLAPGPIETFGLAALEALACGTPVVASSTSALPAVIESAGVAVVGEDFSSGVLELLAEPESVRRRRARSQAERFGWDAAVRGFLAVHEGLGRA